jgi:hypothetical protein
VKQPREQSKRVIGQRRIDERSLPVERFRSAATREAVSVKVRLDDFREEL